MSVLEKCTSYLGVCIWYLGGMYFVSVWVTRLECLKGVKGYGHADADADAMAIQNMRRIYRAISSLHTSDNADIRIDAHRQIYPHGHPWFKTS